MGLMVLVVMLWSCFFSGAKAADHTKPLTPQQFVDYIGYGFTTHYFKTLDFTLYNKQNIADIKAKNFTNLRVRCRQDLPGLNMTVFLNNLEIVIDDCLEYNVTPIISWIHHEGEAVANETHRQMFLQWWRDVATKLKDKDYRVAFNLFTELGTDECTKRGYSCAESLRKNPLKTNNWTKEVVDIIRNSGGNNAQRIIILGSPEKTAKGLDKIDPNIYINETYMMVEWHIYASGPSKRVGSEKFWEGDGTGLGKQNVDTAINMGKDFMNRTGLLSYFAEWMPQDNNNGLINQTEAIYFTRYFLQQLKPIPWSLNTIKRYYNTRQNSWVTGTEVIADQTLNFPELLEVILEVMNQN